MYRITNGVLKSSVTDVRVGLHPSKGGKRGGFFQAKHGKRCIFQGDPRKVSPQKLSRAPCYNRFW
jgi:hypothetical protein